MDKRSELNKEIKGAMAKALFLLLEEKEFDSITISEIVIKAGVARASYYHNFKKKEDIIRYYLMDLLDRYKNKYPANLSHIARYDNVFRTFAYVYEYRRELQALFKAELGQFILDAFNNYIISRSDLTDVHPLYKYPFYSYAGALYNVIYYWITNGCKETAQEMTQAYFASLHLPTEDL